MADIKLLLSNIHLMTSFADLNISDKKNLDARIKSVIKNLSQFPDTSNATLVEVVEECVEDSRVKNVLMRHLKLIDSNDIVAVQSQGKLDEESGVNACAAICFFAAKRRLGPQGINNEDDLILTMNEGIKYYKEQKFSGKVDFDTILERDSSLKPVYPENIEGIDHDLLEEVKNLNLPIDGSIGIDLDSRLKALDDLKKNQNVVGILTCRGETVMISYSKKGEILLFDSHARSYHDMDLGASIRSFKDMRALSAHLKSHLFKEQKEPFQIYYLTNL